MTTHSPQPFSRKMFDVVKRDADFVLYADGEPYITPEKDEITHRTPRLPEHILRELADVESGNTPYISAHSLFRLTQQLKKCVTDPVVENWDALIRIDPLVCKPAFDQALQIKKDQAFMLDLIENQSHLTFFFNGLANAVKCFNNFLLEFSEGHFDFSQKSPDHISQIIKTAYGELADEEAAAVQLLCTCHCCGVVLPILLVRKYITAPEYANALFGLHPPHPATRTLAGTPFQPPALLVLDSALPDFPDWSCPHKSYTHLRNQAWSTLDYLLCADPAKGNRIDIRSIINSGESFNTEFKTSLRWNVRSEKKDSDIEHASLKTINAFLNSAGGVLLIGVRDDGTLEGTDIDKFSNEDRYALHFWNLIKSSMGQEVSPFIHATFERINEKTVFTVQCTRSPQPIFLHQKGFEEEFYIRVGPSSAKLSVREALKYIAGRFEEA